MYFACKSTMLLGSKQASRFIEKKTFSKLDLLRLLHVHIMLPFVPRRLNELLLLVGKYSLFRWRRRAKFRIPDARFSLSSSSSLFSFTSTQQRLLRPSSVCPHMHRQSASPPAADWTGQHTRIQDREEEKPHALTLNIRF